MVAKSTLWARANKKKVQAAYQKRKGTIDGKLISLVTSSRDRAKKKNFENKIDTNFLKELFILQEGVCALSGLKMSIIGKRGTDEYWNSISLDRIDSSKGYLKDNVQLVCTGVNLMKKNMTDEMFVNFCRKVVGVNNG